MLEGRILIISSDEKNSSITKLLLTNRGFDTTVALSGRQGIDIFNTKVFDVVYLDMDVYDISTANIIKELKKKDTDVVIVIFILQSSFNFILDVFNQGASDYIAKPPRPEEIYFKTKRAMMLRQYFLNNKRALNNLDERNIALQKQNIMLAKRIEESTRNLSQLYEDLRETYMRTIKALAQAIDARDHYTHSHSENVTKYAQIIAQEMKVDKQKIDDIVDACQLHDLGKIGVHDYILMKPDTLTPEEFEEVKLHALKGAQILEPLTFLEGVINIVKQHHERYDGSGYPFGLKGEEIDIGARIMSVADTYDAMSSPRPYRPVPFSKDQAIEEIKKGSGTQFDPKVVEVVLKIVDRF